MRKRYTLNSIKITHRMTNSFSSKSAKSTETLIFDICGLEKPSSVFDHFDMRGTTTWSHQLYKILFQYLPIVASYIYIFQSERIWWIKVGVTVNFIAPIFRSGCRKRKMLFCNKFDWYWSDGYGNSGRNVSYQPKSSFSLPTSL